MIELEVPVCRLVRVPAFPQETQISLKREFEKRPYFSYLNALQCALQI